VAMDKRSAPLNCTDAGGCGVCKVDGGIGG
jgi:hypothetical protein